MSGVHGYATGGENLFESCSIDSCKKAMRLCYSDIVKSLDSIPDILDDLVAILADSCIDGVRIVLDRKGRAEAARKLLDVLLLRNEKRAFTTFISALQRTCQDHVIEMMKEKYVESSTSAIPPGVKPRKTTASSEDQQTTVLQSDYGSAAEDRSDKLHLAVLPFVSPKHTHLELHVVCNSSRTELERLIKSREKELPEPIENWLIDIPVPTALQIWIRLNSTSKGEVYHHGCKLVGPSLLASGSVTSYTWLVDLAGAQMSQERKFTLQLFNDAPLQLCGTVSFRDFNGHSRLPSLGFSHCNQMPVTDDVKASEFARQPALGGVYLTSVVKQVITAGDSVGVLFGSTGQLIGTGFCVGRENEKFVMTCYHVVFSRGVLLDKLSITFGDSFMCNKKIEGIGITGCVYFNVELDYAILSVDQPTNMPLPLNGCHTDFDVVRNKSVTSHVFTVIGWPECVDNMRVVDFAANLSELDDGMISDAKKVFTLLFKDDPRLNVFLADYDSMRSVKHNLLFYNISYHRFGSSGSPVLYCCEGELYLVAMHRTGFPDFYYVKGNEDVKFRLPLELTVEAGTRMSCIFNDLKEKHSLLQQLIF